MQIVTPVVSHVSCLLVHSWFQQLVHIIFIICRPILDCKLISPVMVTVVITYLGNDICGVAAWPSLPLVPNSVLVARHYLCLNGCQQKMVAIDCNSCATEAQARGQ